jgi:hypothetical protein
MGSNILPQRASRLAALSSVPSNRFEHDPDPGDSDADDDAYSDTTARSCRGRVGKASASSVTKKAPSGGGGKRPQVPSLLRYKDSIFDALALAHLLNKRPGGAGSRSPGQAWQDLVHAAACSVGHTADSMLLLRPDPSAVMNVLVYQDGHNALASDGMTKGHGVNWVKSRPGQDFCLSSGIRIEESTSDNGMQSQQDPPSGIWVPACMTIKQLANVPLPRQVGDSSVVSGPTCPLKEQALVHLIGLKSKAAPLGIYFCCVCSPSVCRAICPCCILCQGCEALVACVPRGAAMHACSLPALVECACPRLCDQPRVVGSNCKQATDIGWVTVTVQRCPGRTCTLCSWRLRATPQFG